MRRRSSQSESSGRPTSLRLENDAQQNGFDKLKRQASTAVSLTGSSPTDDVMRVDFGSSDQVAMHRTNGRASRDSVTSSKASKRRSRCQPELQCLISFYFLSIICMIFKEGSVNLAFLSNPVKVTDCDELVCGIAKSCIQRPLNKDCAIQLKMRIVFFK